MTTTTQRILCGACRADLTGPADFDNDSIFSCPTCGQSDTYQNVVSEAGDYYAEAVADHLEKQLADIGKGSSFITVTSTPRPKKSYRFILDDIPLT
jgi:hypothetical protein